MVGASLLAIGVVAVVWGPGVWSHPKSAFHSAALETAGDSLTVVLDDGSRLELAARSRLEVLADDSRSAAVRLKRGTLVCDLASESNRRLSVIAAAVEVQVNGTRLTINLNPERDHLEVSVERGSAMVVLPSGSGPNQPLAAGERWSVDRGQVQGPAPGKPPLP